MRRSRASRIAAITEPRSACATIAALRRGRRAGPLLAQRYENLLPRPLEHVRRELAIEQLHDAHPDGLFRAELGQRDMVRVPA